MPAAWGRRHAFDTRLAPLIARDGENEQITQAASLARTAKDEKLIDATLYVANTTDRSMVRTSGWRFAGDFRARPRERSLLARPDSVDLTIRLGRSEWRLQDRRRG